MTNHGVRTIVDNDLCIGCGLCAGLCPRSNIEMRWSAEGELVPRFCQSCPETCELCAGVCPVIQEKYNTDEMAKQLYGKSDDIRYSPELGYFRMCYVGYSLQGSQRARGASGGMATWLQANLLERNYVDAVVAPTKATDFGDTLFRFSVLTNADEINHAASSKYYPVHIADIIREILHEKNDRKYSVVALPCLAYGIRLAMHKYPKLKRKIRFIISLTCGQLPNKCYTELLAAASHINPDDITSVNYRKKDSSTLASNFLFQSYGNDGKAGTLIPWLPLPEHLWNSGYFVHNACNYCDDVFGETADAVFMDAWLPEYVTDPKGHSIVIVRNEMINDLLIDGIISGSCKLSSIAVEKVVQSQSSVIHKKKQLIRGRIYRNTLSNKWIPRKRSVPDKTIYRKNKTWINLHENIMKNSKLAWAQANKSEQPLTAFWRAMRYYELRLRLLHLPKDVKRNIRRIVRYLSRVAKL